jgi:hypothetical protein
MLEPRTGPFGNADFLRFHTRCTLLTVILADLVTLRKQLTSVIDSAKRESQ